MEQEAEEASSAGAVTKVRKDAIPAKKKAKDRPDLKLEVLDRSAESKKPVMLFFSAEGDKASKVMEGNLNSKGIIELAKSVHPVKIDVKNIDRAILVRYGVKAAPAVVLLDHQGKVLQSFTARATVRQLWGAVKSSIAANQDLLKKKAAPAVQKKKK